jgi:hypothetical protein
MLQQGAVRARPIAGRSQADLGVTPLSPLTYRQRFQPLPQPLGAPPYHIDLESILPGIGARAATHKRIAFHAVGDTGGISHPHIQRAVAASMKTDLLGVALHRPAFFLHLGDIVYYNGEPLQYYSQFYDPYDHYDAPIIGIPGNHDGDPVNATQTSLDGWAAYFMTAVPHVDPLSRDAPRVTLSLPNVYFTLDCPYVRIVGMYTNVPEGGSVDSIQQQWLANELATAPATKALVVAMHHPIYSFDGHHSGSMNMAKALQQAINDSRRIPNLVLAGHVHNYQRIERTLVAKKKVPFIVAGGGGYFHLHSMNAPVGATDPNTGATLVAGDARRHSYLTLEVSATQLSGRLTSIAADGTPAPSVDTFTYPTAALTLPAGIGVTL